MPANNEDPAKPALTKPGGKRKMPPSTPYLKPGPRLPGPRGFKGSSTGGGERRDPPPAEAALGQAGMVRRASRRPGRLALRAARRGRKLGSDIPRGVSNRRLWAWSRGQATAAKGEGKNPPSEARPAEQSLSDLTGLAGMGRGMGALAAGGAKKVAKAAARALWWGTKKTAVWGGRAIIASAAPAWLPVLAGGLIVLVIFAMILGLKGGRGWTRGQWASGAVDEARQNLLGPGAYQGSAAHMKIAGIFKGWGIGVTSSGGCSNRNDPNCTSFDGMKQMTVDGMVNLARAAPGVKFVVTAGTEVGHAGGGCDAGESGTHGCGDKLDLAANASTNSFFEPRINSGEMKKAGTYNFGGRLYQKYTLTLKGYTYTITDERGSPGGGHWDVWVMGKAGG